jgi:predicted TIM-barrel fold metal-dependent hydrolase
VVRPLRIWDTHVHFPTDWQNPDADPTPRIEKLVETMASRNVVRASVLSGGRFGPDHDAAIEHLRPHPELMPVAIIDPERFTVEEIQRLHDLGYRGGKLIGPPRPYDSPDYLPLYEKAEELGWPVVFHMGVIGGAVDYARTHPSRDPEAAKRYRMWRERIARMGRRATSAHYMLPFHLETIANWCPDLWIIGAHLGNQGYYQDAASVARWRPRVMFDLSGGETIEEHAESGGFIGGEMGVEKLTFGSDCGVEEIPEHLDRFEAMFDRLDLTARDRDRIWYLNAAEAFGVEEPQFAGEDVPPK